MKRYITSVVAAGLGCWLLSGCASRSAPGSVEPGPMTQVAARAEAADQMVPGEDELRYVPLRDRRKRILPLLNNPEVFVMYGRPTRSQDGYSMRSDLWIASYKFPSRPSEWALIDEMEKTSVPMQHAGDLQIDENGRLLIPTPVSKRPDVRAVVPNGADAGGSRPWVRGNPEIVVTPAAGMSSPSVPAGSTGGTGSTGGYGNMAVSKAAGPLSMATGVGGGSTGGGSTTPAASTTNSSTGTTAKSAGSAEPASLNSSSSLSQMERLRQLQEQQQESQVLNQSKMPAGFSQPGGSVPAPTSGRGVPPDRSN